MNEITGRSTSHTIVMVRSNMKWKGIENGMELKTEGCYARYVTVETIDDISCYHRRKPSFPVFKCVISGC